MRWLAVEIAKVLTNVISLPYGVKAWTVTQDIQSCHVFHGRILSF